MITTTWVEVDLSAIVSNAKAIKAYPQSSSLIAVIKADAYGHGVIPVAEALREEATMYAVATVAEAIELRTADIRKPVLVLFNALPVQAETIIEYELTASVYEPTLCKALSRAAQAKGTSVKVHLDVDTGMNRGGIWYTEAIDFLKWLITLEKIEIEGIFTHFATADEADKSRAHLQLDRFKSVLSTLSKLNLRPSIVHAANSAAALTLPNAHFDAVRVGLSLYGVYPSSEVRRTSPVSLQPALSWKARLICLRRATQGEGISYGRTYIVDEPTWLATLPVGHADGYSRALSNRGEALIGGVKCQQVGLVCMDGTVFRIASQEGDENLPLHIGDEAVLVGRQGDLEISVDRVAEKAGTISYEILTGIGKRISRVYVN
ncbi:alanine racemase [Candidatus Poribacteria bacterium]|nr:alanine racemase [Candidatus Poribacteria bacterium]